MKIVNQFDGIYRHYLARLIRNHPYLFLAFFSAIAIEFFMPNSIALTSITRHICALNFAALFYIVMTSYMMFFSKKKNISHSFRLQDEGQILILLLSLGAVVTSLVAIVAELAIAKEMHGFLKFEHMALAAITILVSWTFIHLIFALHYAHDYYLNLSRNDDAGLIFPGIESPDYADFLYFSCIIGTSAQTADISYSSRKMRRIGTVHCIFSFFFNTTILALTINIASGLI